MNNNIITVWQSQADAIKKMHKGCVLNGGVGTGKSRTGLAYFYTLNGGEIYISNTAQDGSTYITDFNGVVIKNPKPQTLKNEFIKYHKLILITTPKKRDSGEWEKELNLFGLSEDPEKSKYPIEVYVDSWYNIANYSILSDCCFIFDEQKAIGSGKFANMFIQIALKNFWYMLTATPGDEWIEYYPLFRANNFYHTKTQFLREHVVFNQYVNYPCITKYINVDILEDYKSRIIVEMKSNKNTTRNIEYMYLPYDKKIFNYIKTERKNPFDDNKGIKTPGAYISALRRCCRQSEYAKQALINIYKKHKKIIVFYRFNYELEDIIDVCKKHQLVYAQLNGSSHDDIPSGDSWIYIVNYGSGAEAWNCTSTNAMILWDMPSSYKLCEQSLGRIDRSDTPYKELYYYIFITDSDVDKRSKKALELRKNFNESGYYKNSIKNV